MLIININNLFSSSLYAIIIFQSCIFSITFINNLLYLLLWLTLNFHSCILSITNINYLHSFLFVYLPISTISTLFSLFIFLSIIKCHYEQSAKSSTDYYQELNIKFSLSLCIISLWGSTSINKIKSYSPSLIFILYITFSFSYFSFFIYPYISFFYIYTCLQHFELLTQIKVLSWYSNLIDK